MIHAGTSSTRERRGRYFVVGLAAVIVMLLGSGVCVAQIQNSSFEATYAGIPFPRPLPSLWGRMDNMGRQDHPSFNSYCTSLWKSDGAMSLGVFGRNGKPIVSGNYQSFRQYVNLTGKSAVAFDVRLAAYPSGPFEHFEASLLVDGVPLWSQTEGGVYLDQQVNVSKLAGWRLVEMRITAIDSGTFSAAYWSQWDSFELVEGPTAIEAFIDLDPDTLNLESNGKWITGYIELADGFDAALIDGATVTLEGIHAHMGDEGWATPQANEGNLSDLNENGVPERMVKFERAAVQEIVQPPEATVTVKGFLTDGTPFEGAATIQVIDKGGKKK